MGILIAVIVSYFVVNTLHLIVHEMGHAIPSLLLYKGPVTVRLGNVHHNQGKRIRLGRLTFWIGSAKRIVNWNNQGSCSSPEFTASLWKDLVIIAMGPLFSLGMGLLAVGFIWFGPQNPYLTTFFIIMGLQSLLTMVVLTNNQALEYHASYQHHDTDLFRWRRKYNKEIKLFRPLRQQLQKIKDPEARLSHYHNWMEENAHLGKQYPALYDFQLEQSLMDSAKFWEQWKHYPKQASPSPFALELKGIQLLHEGKISESFKVLRTASNKGRASNSLYTNLAYCLLQAHDYTRAKSFLGLAMRLDPQDLTSRALWARLQIRMGQQEEGLQFLRQLPEPTHPDNDFHLNKAWALVEAGLYDEANSETEKCEGDKEKMINYTHLREVIDRRDFRIPDPVIL